MYTSIFISTSNNKACTYTILSLPLFLSHSNVYTLSLSLTLFFLSYSISHNLSFFSTPSIALKLSIFHTLSISHTLPIFHILSISRACSISLTLFVSLTLFLSFTLSLSHTLSIFYALFVSLSLSLIHVHRDEHEYASIKYARLL